MPIPKHVYQTCWTNIFHPTVEARFQRMREMNPEYTFHLFSDKDMEKFVQEVWGGRVYESYMKLNVPVAKVDFWRYLYLYTYGGIYLDIDADITCPLSDIVRENDSAIISAEGNPYKFVQWCLMFEKNHPILGETIRFVIDNLEKNRYPNDILQMTGPVVYSKAIYKIQVMNGDVDAGCPAHHQILDETDWTSPNKIKYRIYGIDYGRKLTCNVPGEYELLYGEKTHWRHDTRPLLLI